MALSTVANYWWVLIAVVLLAVVLRLLALHRDAASATPAADAAVRRRYHPGPVELVNRQFHVSQDAQRAAWAMLIVVTLAIIAVMAWVFNVSLGPETLDGAKVGDVIMKRLSRGPAELALFLLPIVITAVQIGIMHYSKSDRIVLSADAVTFKSGWPRWLRRLHPDWSISWRDIRSAEFSVASALLRPELVPLTLSDGIQSRRLVPFLWIDPRAPDTGPRGPGAWRAAALDRDVIVSAVSGSILVRYLTDAGVALDSARLQSGAAVFALEKNIHTVAAMLMLAALIVYAITDVLLGPEAYPLMPTGLLPVFVGGGTVAAGATVYWLKAARVPTTESWGVGAVLGVVFALALHPGLLRINMYTDTNGLRAYPYTVRADARLVPLDPALPEIDYFDDGPYWDQFPPWERYEVRLRKGGLGFYQFDRATIVEALRRFEAAHGER